MYYLLFYDTVDDYIEKRAPFREKHLALAQDYHQKGRLIMAGALAEPADGAVLVFCCDSPEIVNAFAEKDPYVQNGLITRWYVREWTVVLGGNKP